ncbi:MAG: response regulator [Chloroflexi bacterium]|nr:response regulator [Chloroflexota bacterium]MDA1219811.1 response regulator [Chloroflexota bacterium]
MAKILIAEDTQSIREVLGEVLAGKGYEIVQAANGRVAFEMACQEPLDLILMDVWMPDMDGLEALRHLRENSATERIPVIMLTSVPPQEGEQQASHLGAVHYITKPFEFETLMSAIRSTLKRAESEDAENNLIATHGKLIPLEKLLGGGINQGTITLIEGSTFTGKSVLCQHLAYGSLMDGMGVAYFASDHTPETLSARMASLGMEISTRLQSGKLGVNTLPKFTPEEDSSEVMASLPKDITRLPSRCRVVVVDAITNLVLCAQESATLGFFYSLKLLCSEGKTVILAADPFSFDANMLQRLHDLCDTHITLSNRKIGEKLMKNLEVLKVNTMNLEEGNSLAFEVQKDLGMKVMPFGRAKA